MWNGKKKAITFSFDDGVTQDIRLVEIFNKYNLKCTFNLNSSLLGLPGQLERNGKIVRHDKVPANKVKEIYAGHEVAVHTLTHPYMKSLSDEAIFWQVEQDRKTLSALCGCEVIGMAYPGGTDCIDARVAKVIRERTPIRYARTTTSTNNFDPPTGDLLLYDPTTYYVDENFEEIVDKFLALETDKPQLLYIWGHSYEMDVEYITWENFERICKKLANRDDIFYGTNKEVLL